MQNHATELESAQSETALLRERIQQLELTGAQTEEAKNEADRRREALQNELDNVHRALEQKDRSFAQQEAEFKESNELLHAQLRNLQSQLTEKQQLLDAKDEDLAHASGRIVALEARITQLESLRAEAEAAAAAEVARVRHESQSEAAALQTSLREKEQALQQYQAAIAELEVSLDGQIEDLRNQLAQKQELLDRRDREFQTIGSETVVLRERIAQLESAAAEVERFGATEGDRIRAELQAQLATAPGATQRKRARVSRNPSVGSRI